MKGYRFIGGSLHNTFRHVPDDISVWTFVKAPKLPPYRGALDYPKDAAFTVERETYYRRFLTGDNGECLEFFLHSRKSVWDALFAVFGPEPSKSTVRRRKSQGQIKAYRQSRRFG